MANEFISARMSIDRIDGVEDPNDRLIMYWVAWNEGDNPDAWKLDPNELQYRVFRDDAREQAAEALTEPMSRAEAYEHLRRICVLIGGKEV